ncbi:acetyl-CoA C-acyltransferase [Psychromonas sp. B3M02]|uniref:acetyl-CoA C-acetyltransferase n=1 Tax=Psychromonas sp. B3M02 TaxID=2267226 RepID=UPI000DEAB007|nr:acetyl-CoA C-acetyltransferase [Psychromonas sp. B3M02]RBW46918.1 acetyl-CoA C-acyltransferase [Psychromonas sp. B3M02]
MKDIVIVSAVRTAIGSFSGMFANVSAVELGITAVKRAIDKAGIKPDQVEQVILGNVLAAGHGQNIARQVQIKAGIPQESTAFTVSKVCGSGLKAVTIGIQAIQTNESEIIIVGGTESMSNAAHVIDQHRSGKPFGHTQITDTILCDGLTDSFTDIHMGITAENLAEKYNISRVAQDNYALQSQQRTQAAIAENKFAEEIAPHSITTRQGEIICDTDEFPRSDTTLKRLNRLKPAFKKEGTVTAGNSSGINDGASALVLMSAEKANALGLTPLARIVSHASAGVDPNIMGFGPVPATQKALLKANLTIQDIDLTEANEAFAAQALSVIQGLSLDPNKTNVNGGAISLGHPIGASGARILVTLIHELNKRDARYGLATLCIGGGQGTAIVVENIK